MLLQQSSQPRVKFHDKKREHTKVQEEPDP